MLPPKPHKYFKVTDLNGCYHISLVTADQLWVSDKKNNPGFVDTVQASDYEDDGIILFQCKHILKKDNYFDDHCNGPHTVNNDRELIYINRNFDIMKLSMDMDTSTMLIKRT